MLKRKRYLNAAKLAQNDAVDIYRFTQHLKERNGRESERLALVEDLWEMVYADGEVHEFERQCRLAGGRINWNSGARNAWFLKQRVSCQNAVGPSQNSFHAQIKPQTQSPDHITIRKHRHPDASECDCVNVVSSSISAAHPWAMHLPESLDDHAGAIMFGGPMSANDGDEFVKRENRLARRAA